MATNHTKQLAECESVGAAYLWRFKKNTKISTKAVSEMARIGVISMSNLLEQVLLDNGKLIQSNKTGEDFHDGSDAKYATARNRIHINSKERHWADVAGLKNKRGTLRIFINHYSAKTDAFTPYMFKVPYKVWSKCVTKSGVLKFYFSNKEEGLTKKTIEQFGKFRVDSIKELAS